MHTPEDSLARAQPDTAAASAPAAAPLLAPADGWLRLIREALAGSRRDLTTMPLGRAVILLAIPMVLEMVMESVFAIADIFWVSKLGPDAVAAVVMTESMLAIVYALSMGLSMGVAALVARRTGEKDPAGAARAAAQGLLIGLGVAAVLSLVGGTLAPRLLLAMGASPSAAAAGAGYTRMMLVGCPTIVLLFLLNAVFRGAGDAAISMRTLWLANGVNIVLGPFLVFGWGPFPRLGVTGAAVATTIGRGLGVLYQMQALRRGRSRLVIDRQHLRADPRVMRAILRLSSSAVVQMLIGMTSWIFLVRILSAFGSAALAGFGVALRVAMFFLLPSWGMANAAATLVGQNLGAGHPERAEQAAWRAAFYNLIFLGVVGLLLFLFATPVVRIFTEDAAVVGYGVRCLRLLSAGFLFYAYGMVMTQALNGAGDTRTPTLINLFCFWLFELPFAYALSRFTGLGPTGVYAAAALAFCLIAVVSVPIFRRGRWKTVRV